MSELFVPIREVVSAESLSPLDQARLLGSKCQDCGEVSLGKKFESPNCCGDKLTIFPLNTRGKIRSYMVIRHCPPGDYQGPDAIIQTYLLNHSFCSYLDETANSNCRISN